MDSRTLKFVLDRVQRRLNIIRNKGHTDSSGTLNISKNLKGRFCVNPFSQMDVYEGGKVHSCCSTWLPTSIGNIRKIPINEVWNSPVSQMIRESILDGSFRYCNHKICPMIQAGSLPTIEEASRNPVYREIIETGRLKLDELPTFINLCNDESCNLYCPSCRRQKINYPKGKEFEKRQHLQDVITQQLFAVPTDRHFSVNITGSGDPFASAVFRDFLYNLCGEDFPNLSIHLQTNGVLLTPRTWQRMHKIHSNIAAVLVSFDAGTEATYNITRRGGNWKLLLENTHRLGHLRSKNELKYLRLDFVVQQANYQEMEQFIQIGKSVKADKVAFSMVLDWGTWSREEYQEKCIWKQGHPQFDDFIKVLQSPIFDDQIVSLGNLTEYRALALNTP